MKLHHKKIVFSSIAAIALLGTSVIATVTSTVEAAGNESASITGPDTVNTVVNSGVAYSTAGSASNARIKNTQDIEFYVEPNITPAEKKAIANVLKQWEIDTGFKFYIIDDKSNAQIIYTIGTPSNPKADAEIHTTYQVQPDDQNIFLPGTIIEVDLPAPGWYNQYMIRTFMHETGHALGLYDIDDPSQSLTSIMYGTMTEKNVTNCVIPQQTDINNIKALYNN